MSDTILYSIITILLFIAMQLYFRIAVKYNIVDKPNHRSSHKEVTLRGGGIIYWVAALFVFLIQIKLHYLFFIGITIISLISFIDDIKSLSTKIRFVCQFLALTIIGFDLDVFTTQPLWVIAIGYILSIGIINAYNFMDGINGMTGLFTLITFTTMYYINKYVVVGFVSDELILLPIIASVIFLYFNFRKKARCFAGDVGSITIAFWSIYLLGKLILVTGNPVWLCLLAVYGVDTVCTIFHRLYLKQNIMEAHRMHLYQVLSNERGIDHRTVSVIYALLQSFISFIVICNYENLPFYTLIAIVVLPLTVLYTMKFFLIKKQI